MSQTNPLEKLPFRAKFSAEATVISPKALQKREAFASLEALEQYIPKEVVIDGNIDLLYVAFNGTVVNQFNENGDGISVATAAKILPRFANKQINLQHERSDIVGHTFNAGFASLEDSIPMSIEDALKISDPLNLSVSGAIYKVVNPKLISLLKESSNAESELYHTVSTSWEIAFSEYLIALGSKNLKDAEIVTDPNKIEELSKYLRGEKTYEWERGAEGTLPDGTPVFRLIVGEDVLPTGFGLTTIPAAAVKGIHVLSDEIELDDDDEGVAENLINLKNNEKKCSIKSQVAVNQNETNIKSIKMDKELIIQAFQEVLASQPKDDKDLQEAVASAISQVKEALKDADSFYVKELETERKAKEELKSSEEALKKDLETAQADLAEVKQELEKIKEESKQKAIAENFSARMDNLESDYELTDEDREVIASQIRELNDEDYTLWKTNFNRFAEAKSKTYIAAQTKSLKDAVETAKQEAVASTDNKTEDLEDVLDKVTASDSNIPNASTDDSEVSLVDRIATEVEKHIDIS